MGWRAFGSKKQSAAGSVHNLQRFMRFRQRIRLSPGRGLSCSADPGIRHSSRVIAAFHHLEYYGHHQIERNRIERERHAAHGNADDRRALETLRKRGYVRALLDELVQLAERDDGAGQSLRSTPPMNSDTGPATLATMTIV